MYVYTSCMGARTGSARPQNPLPLLPCACANLRRAARAVTRLYNRELRPQKIEITQFTILMALQRTGEISQGKLGGLLALDSTTLTRMLGPLKKRGWIQEKEGRDRRFRLLRLTGAGQQKLQQTLPRWNKAQQRLRSALGDDGMTQLGEILGQVAESAAVG
jgi:DNA-binding MarR family transcriptional regulator